MPDYDLLIATDDVARAGAEEVPVDSPDRFAFYAHDPLILISGPC